MKLLPWLILSMFVSCLQAGDLRITSFQADATPPIGSPLSNGLVETGSVETGSGCNWLTKIQSHDATIAAALPGSEA
jgi:hypothetical protein